MTKPHICILATQYSGWGAYSGFGSMPRTLARALVAEGFPVTVITQRRKEQRPLEEIDGVAVRSYGTLNVGELIHLVRQSEAAARRRFRERIERPGTARGPSGPRGCSVRPNFYGPRFARCSSCATSLDCCPI
jgi:hypothetical protein